MRHSPPVPSVVFRAGILLLAVLAASILPSCGRGEDVEAHRRERARLEETVERIHAEHLKIVTRKIPPELLPPQSMAYVEGGGTIRDLHETSEMYIEGIDRYIRDLDAEIEEWEAVVEARKGKPNPFGSPEEAFERYWLLYFELKRVEYLKWRRP